MSENRIRVAKDKAELVKSLIASTENNSPFQTFADVILFAAVLGAKNKQRRPLGEISKKEPGPISIEIFLAHGYDPVMKLIAIAATENINVISPDRSDVEQQRIHIFEEYANGGLELLDRELCGAVDYTERILLMLSVDAKQRATLPSQAADPNTPKITGTDPTATAPIEFDLRKFLG
ncbi:DNA phosphorothioation-associated protein 4 [Chamaesiphon sp. VAR_69_metabat_338]|uniref:DNA phosphorothioation-associated protein 4 n=1 Tax=Chamaesiphon sp. VAR_69_metabat_338 TaxID=2964704 RepID=UPI00286DABC0|nr:DNA phosphorothioation-associated protein 4 [Chamaesiphon sp. VAR_69_metabat_338]